MKTQLLKKLLMLVALFAATSMSAQVFTFNSGLEGWADGFSGASNGMPVHAPTGGEAGTGALKLTRLSNNANFGYNTGLNPGIDGITKKFIKIRYRNETLGTQFRVQGSSTAGTIANTVFPIAAGTGSVGSGVWTTSYLDMTGVANWSADVNNLDILVRVGWVSGEAGSIYVDSIEFLNSIPPATVTGILKNPSFEDYDGTVSPWNPSSSTYAATVISSDDSHGTGSYSLKSTYSAPDAGVTNFVFNDYVHSIGSSTTDDVVATMWVKVVRPGTPGTSPLITVQGQARTGTTDVGTSLVTLGQNKTTTKTDGSWEQITYAFTPAAAYTHAQFRYGISGADLMAGDIVYVDDIAANHTPSLSVKGNTLEGVAVYPNPATGVVNVNSVNGGLISVYNTLGAQVLTEKATSVSHQLNVSGLSSGVYLLEFTSEGKSAISKLVIK
ncbi:hypothetical protein FFWV33_18140 [Flavobacterium faecale]|uniref:Secretion system C-terminal sorting domain-containing protein n=1 Tax=Flavobacterium faecale TaxID=1355330 RepID=A0A2S1LI50_9FLAO|nr:T9SS type A sorting domain-containing protein [Flavobacterium faecale]AWG23311.1 hypothetical protein FFWV33_18140 [Flavobacterium faecale]